MSEWGLRFPRHAEDSARLAGGGEVPDGEAAWAEAVPVERAGEGEPGHLLLECDNRHGMEWLLGTGRAGSFDVVYCDPPYNTGASGWLYNNRIRRRGDGYPSALWLSRMERRLLLARSLLREDGGLVFAIDENELAHALLLLRDLMGPSRRTHVVTVVHNPRGIQGRNFSVTNEFALFSLPCDAEVVSPRPRGEPLVQPFRKWGAMSRREDAPNCAYPVRMDGEGRFSGAGDPIPPGEPFPFLGHRTLPCGGLEFLPTNPGGGEGRWRYAREGMERVAARLRVRRDRAGEPSLVLETADRPETTVWSGAEYAAFAHGSALVKRMTGQEFPFPKSLWTVRDCIGSILRTRPGGSVLDPWGGSGTTAHATMCLNAADGGSRTSVTLCRNESNAPGLRGLDGEERERRGVVRAVAWPRIRAALEGRGVPEGAGPFPGEAAEWRRLVLHGEPGEGRVEVNRPAGWLAGRGVPMPGTGG